MIESGQEHYAALRNDPAFQGQDGADLQAAYETGLFEGRKCERERIVRALKYEIKFWDDIAEDASKKAGDRGRFGRAVARAASLRHAVRLITEEETRG